MADKLQKKLHIKCAFALTALLCTKSQAMSFKFLGHNEEAKPPPQLLTLAQTFKQQLSESAEDASHEDPIDYTLHTGYWFDICVNIQDAWNFCQQEEIVNKSKEASFFYPAYENCFELYKKDEEPVDDTSFAESITTFVEQIFAQEDEAAPEGKSNYEMCLEHNEQRENWCHNQVLMYKQNMYSTLPIWQQIAENSSFRRNIIKTCHNTFVIIHDGFEYFQCPHVQDGTDKLLDALTGMNQPEWESDEDYDEFEVTPVAAWSILDSYTFQYDPQLNATEQGHDVEINGQFSKDLELFYKPEDARKLFDYNHKLFEQVCDLATTMLNETDQEKYNQLDGELNDLSVFNYLSEEEIARKTLYYVCLFRSYKTESQQKVLYDNQENFHKLFQ